jgi:hypothetical protein
MLHSSQNALACAGVRWRIREWNQLAIGEWYQRKSDPEMFGRVIYCFFSRDSDIEYIMVNFGFPTCLMDFLRVSITVMSQISRFPIECNNLRHSRITLSLPCTAQYPVRRYLDRFRASCKFLSVRSFTVH